MRLWAGLHGWVPCPSVPVESRLLLQRIERLSVCRLLTLDRPPTPISLQWVRGDFAHGVAIHFSLCGLDPRSDPGDTLVQIVSTDTLITP